MNKTVLIAIADGIEEVETVAIIDVLRRSGATVTIASIYPDRLTITGAHHIKLTADVDLASCANQLFDLMAIPGGLPGADNLRDSKTLAKLLKAQKKADKLFAAICASPAVVLAHHGLLNDKQAICYPGFEANLPNHPKPTPRVLVDGNCITSQGPGTALEFGIELVKQLFDETKANTIKEQMLINS